MNLLDLQEKTMATKKLEFRMPKRNDPQRDARYKKMAVLMENADVMRITVNVPTNLHKRFKVQCAKEGLQMKEVVVALVRKYMKDKTILSIT